jgi:hypothetical protein
MSVLRFPRLYFRGEISWDPCLANNSPGLYDAANVQLVLPSGVTLDQYKQYVLANADTLRIWNYYGTHDARFENVLITGGAVAPHQPTLTTDPLIGKQISLCGKLVDVDPAAVHTSQIFFDEINVGDETTGFVGLRVQRMHSRWINFNRSLPQLPIAGFASVAWQTTLAKNGLQFFGQTDSALLQAFEAALQRDDVAGLMIRFQTYRTLYFQNGVRNKIPQQPRNSVQLKQLYLTGENFSNPAYSALVGVVGLWMRNDEAISAPGGRYLVPAGNVATASRRSPTGQMQPVPVPPGPAVFELDENTKTLSFDFGSSFPEQDQELEKADIGELEFVADNQGTPTHIATLPYAAYAKASYEERAGIIDIDLSSHSDNAIIEKIQTGQLAVNCLQKGKSLPALAESPFLVIGDERGVYLNEGETQQVPLSVLLSGQPAPAGTQILVNAYDTNLDFVETVTTLTLSAPGMVELTCTAQTAGIVNYQFLPFAAGQPAPAQPFDLDPMAGFFITVRTLPLDDALAANTPDEQLTWDFIYDNILRVYDSFNPIMSRTSDPAIYKPLDNQSRMETLVQAIRRVISEANFESASHMPITRDMSTGRRLLLTRWCDLVLAGTAPSMHLTVAAFDRGLTTALNIAALTKDPRMGSV